ncbi:MAG: hemerythrin domain-containing protein, partial [Deltaproteobacteria bacterium]|nr:hemerythrin domain-containing protein [Deltaproteobacteria bacterium]
DSIFERFQDALRENRWEDASHDFREFSVGLRRHIRVEEEILFPVFEEKTGMTESGPTFVMRMEHTEIKELLDKIISATDAKNESQATNSSRDIFNILSDHNMKEEHILYPESDSFLTEAERAKVIKKAQTA